MVVKQLRFPLSFLHSMPGFSTRPPAGSRVLYLSHSADESVDSVGVELGGAEVQLTHLPHDQLASISAQPSDSFDYVLARPSLSFSPAFVAALLRVLRPGGSFVSLWPAGAPVAVAQGELVLGGFVDVAAKPVEGGATELVSQRPPWALNASVPLRLKKKTPAAAAAAAAPVAAVVPSASKDVWNLAADDLNELADDLADEDALLAKDAFVAPALPRAVPSDCGTSAAGPKKACKNCSCGLAEEQLAKDQGKPVTAATKVVSACGSVSHNGSTAAPGTEDRAGRIRAGFEALGWFLASESALLTSFIVCCLVCFLHFALLVRPWRCLPLQRLPLSGQAGIQHVRQRCAQAQAVSAQALVCVA
jgi:SAM-dependent methyltransferase